MGEYSVKTLLLIVLLFAVLVLAALLIFQRKRTRRSHRSHYIDALYALIDRRKDDALKLLTAAVRNGESDIDAYIQLGNLLREKKMPEKAYQIHKSLTVRRDLAFDEEKSIQIALAEDLADMGKMERAVNALNVIHRRKNDPEIAATLHRLYHRCGDFESAYEMLKGITSRRDGKGSSERAAYLASVARTFMERGEKETARKFLSRGHKEDSRSAPVLYLSGKNAIERKDLESAARMWQDLLSIDISFFDEVLPVLEKVLFESGRFEMLEEILLDLRARYQDFPGIAVALASFYVKKGELARGAELLEEELKYERTTLQVSSMLALIYLEMGRKADAVRMLEETGPAGCAPAAWKCAECGKSDDYPAGYCSSCSEFGTSNRLS